ncbi:hypothetical protein J6590_084712 [Homalodisca vitripennis]|nr:hypothetical protein J6590_084712 [Homalodisca vitripennis]
MSSESTAITLPNTETATRVTRRGLEEACRPDYSGTTSITWSRNESSRLILGRPAVGLTNAHLRNVRIDYDGCEWKWGQSDRLRPGQDNGSANTQAQSGAARAHARWPALYRLLLNTTLNRPRCGSRCSGSEQDRSGSERGQPHSRAGRGVVWCTVDLLPFSLILILLCYFGQEVQRRSTLSPGASNITCRFTNPSCEQIIHRTFLLDRSSYFPGIRSSTVISWDSIVHRTFLRLDRSPYFPFSLSASQTEKRPPVFVKIHLVTFRRIATLEVYHDNFQSTYAKYPVVVCGEARERATHDRQCARRLRDDWRLARARTQHRVRVPDPGRRLPIYN